MTPKIFQPLSVHNARWAWRAGVWMLKHFFRLLPATAEVFLRHNIGRRYMGTLWSALLLYAFYAMSAPPQAPLVRPFLVAFIVMLFEHSLSNSSRNRQGRSEPHTYSTGDPWPIWERLGLRQDVAQQYGEPLLCFLLGVGCRAFDPFLAAWLTSSAVALFVKEQVVHFRLRQRQFDLHDGQIESQQMSQSLRRDSTHTQRHPRRPSIAHLPGEVPLRGNNRR